MMTAAAAVAVVIIIFFLIHKYKWKHGSPTIS